MHSKANKPTVSRTHIVKRSTRRQAKRVRTVPPTPSPSFPSPESMRFTASSLKLPLPLFGEAVEITEGVGIPLMDLDGAVQRFGWHREALINLFNSHYAEAMKLKPPSCLKPPAIDADEAVELVARFGTDGINPHEVDPGWVRIPDGRHGGCTLALPQSAVPVLIRPGAAVDNPDGGGAASGRVLEITPTECVIELIADERTDDGQRTVRVPWNAVSAHFCRPDPAALVSSNSIWVATSHDSTTVLGFLVTEPNDLDKPIAFLPFDETQLRERTIAYDLARRVATDPAMADRIGAKGVNLRHLGQSFGGESYPSFLFDLWCSPAVTAMTGESDHPQRQPNPIDRARLKSWLNALIVEHHGTETLESHPWVGIKMEDSMGDVDDVDLYANTHLPPGAHRVINS